MSHEKQGADEVSRVAGVSAYDEKKKLSELQTMILQKGDAERESILTKAREESEKWTEEQTRQLDVMLKSIRDDAAKRCADMSRRQLSEAESARDKSRLRFQNELIRRALMELQNALVAFAKRPDYEAILTGLAFEVCRDLEQEGKVVLRLREEDASYGEAVARALTSSFSNIDVAFDPTPARIIGGVYLYSEDGKWRVSADWKSKVEEMADDVARAVLAEL
jgi:V/A-type H+-transporting ATPase subunit E